jgi:glycosyltransferase involved in cell wall biosynthesis
MNLLFVVHAYPPSFGGSQLLTAQVAERCVAFYGDTATVYTTVADDPTYFWRGGRSLPPGVEVRKGVTVERFPVIYQGRFLRRSLAAAAYRLRLPGHDYLRTLEQGPIIPDLAHRIATSGADVVFATAFPLRHMYDALAGAHAGGIPVVMLGALHLHDRWGYDRQMIFRAIRQADHYIAHTPYERDAVVQRGADPARVHVIGAGVDLAGYDPRLGKEMRARLGLGDDPVVVMLAKQVQRKRFDLLLDAMQPVWEEFPQARLLIAGGRTTYTPTLEAMIGALPPARRDRVTRVSDFTEAEKPALLAAGDLFVLTSVEESFGIVLAEAWGSGLPVIGAGSEAVGSLIQDGVDGLHFDYPDPISLARAIRTLLAQPDLRTQLGQAGRAKVLAHYTWDRVAAQIRTILAQAARPAPAPR